MLNLMVFLLNLIHNTLTGLTGSWFKICGGRGLVQMQNQDLIHRTSYAEDDTKNPNVDMLGFIAVPYDNGQYSIYTNYACMEFNWLFK